MITLLGGLDHVEVGRIDLLNLLELFLHSLDVIAGDLEDGPLASFLQGQLNSRLTEHILEFLDL
jgi:hypothetical protein